MQTTLFSWNVNGIRAVHKKGLFVPFVEKHQPDILCLQETKIDASTVAEWRGTDLAHAKRSFLRQGVAVATSRSKKAVGGVKSEPQRSNSAGIDLQAGQHQSEVDLSDYTEYWNSAEKKGYSGTAIFSRTKPLAVINGLPEDIIKKYKVTRDIYGDPNKEGRVIASE